MVTILAILFVLICVLLIGIILLQKGRGGGLSGAFGGAGGHSAFGSRTGDMFTWITVVLVGLFLVVATVTVRYCRPRTVIMAPQEIGQPEQTTDQGEDTAPDTQAAPDEQPPADDPDAPAKPAGEASEATEQTEQPDVEALKAPEPPEQPVAEDPTETPAVPELPEQPAADVPTEAPATPEPPAASEAPTTE